MTVSNNLICISHSPWDFVYQRPQHLMRRAAQTWRIFFVEEPRFEEKASVRLEVRKDKSGVLVVTPFLPSGSNEAEVHTQFAQLLEHLLEYHEVEDYTLWVYTPTLLPALFTLSESGHKPQLVIYDCMDEFASFRFESPELRERETQLFAWSDVVFMGGHSLYEAKCKQHVNVHPFPSSVEVDHFAKATLNPSEPHDLQTIPHPRIGFIGMVDERVDAELLRHVAAERSHWHSIMIGPVVNISEDELPKGENIHYLGQKQYEALPDYLAHIDVAMMPFAVNDSTRFISPTTTPEYLAAGKPVISTPIRDVVRPYGEKDLVVIAETSDEFMAGLEQLIHEDQSQRQSRATTYVNRLSWDQTWQGMERCMTKALTAKQAVVIASIHKQLPLRPSKLTPALSASMGKSTVAGLPTSAKLIR